MGAGEFAAVLEAVQCAIRRYCILPDDAAYDAVTLWVAVTHVTPALDVAPRLIVRSPEKRSGKTRLLEVLSLLVHDPVRFADVSVPYLFRRIEKSGENPPTLLLDEADTIFGAGRPSERAEALRGILNTGFQRGFVYGRVERPNNQLREYRVFALAAIASIGPLPDTIEDRALVLLMRRRLPSESVEQFRLRNAAEYLASIRQRLHDALEASTNVLLETRPELPVEDRAADLWEPLVAVAQLAGDEWINRAWAAAVAMVERAREEEHETNVGLAVLAGVREIFTAAGDPAWMPSMHLIAALSKVDEQQELADALGVAGLARVLRAYGIRPLNHRQGESVRKGYRLIDLRDAWDRYLPSTSLVATPAIPLHPRDHGESSRYAAAAEPLQAETKPPRRRQSDAEHRAAAQLVPHGKAPNAKS